MMRHEQVEGVKEEARHSWLAAEIDAVERNVEKQVEEMRKAMATIKTTLIGILVSTTTAALLLAANLAVT